MVVAVVVLGALAQAGAWWLVVSRRWGVWTGVAPAIGLAGVLALVVRAPALSGDVPVPASILAGLGAGVVLYVGTRVFVALVGPKWPLFARHAEQIYRAGGRHPSAAAILAAGAVAVGEEVFWRGLAQGELTARLDSAIAGAGVAWVVYVVANAPSRNLAILAGAVVGGAVWGALAWWTAGVLASVLAHATWTALMLARPAVARSAQLEAA